MNFPSYLKDINILYIEDVAFNKDLLKQVLNSFSHEGDLLFATSISMGVEKINDYYSNKKRTLDLIILDLNVPDKTNKEADKTMTSPMLEVGTTIPLIRKIRAFKHPISNVPIIVITNESDPNKKMLALEAGADKIIEKLQDPDKTINVFIELFKKRYGNPDQYFSNKNKKS